jgi:hypothetical protein
MLRLQPSDVGPRFRSARTASLTGFGRSFVEGGTQRSRAAQTPKRDNWRLNAMPCVQAHRTIEVARDAAPKEPR